MEREMRISGCRKVFVANFARSLAGAALGCLIAFTGAGPASADAGFRKWVNDFYATAAKHGISKNTYQKVFAGVDSPDPYVLESARYQPEFVSDVWDYLDARVSESTIANGLAMKAKYKRWLDIIEARYGVDRDILLAIWSMESSYGKALERDTAMHNVARSLATLAYADRRRAKYARAQLVSALKIVQKGDVSADGLVGSWAGAMGHTQFIPTSYEAWAQDIDGDGRRNIWQSVPDALASSANLLRKNGWQTGNTWGYEVILPRGFNTGLADKNGHKISDFVKLGVKRPDGRPFPRMSDNAVLKFPGGKNGPAFLMIRNFYIIKRYNNADKYALAVGHLADRLRGGGPFVQEWPRGYTPLSEPERKEVQIYLLRGGFYDGEIDGNIGSGSREAIRKWQKLNGVKPDGFPSKALLDKLRGR